MSKKAIILSGGGSKGAWGVGVVKALMEMGSVYDVAIGTSTGSLMAPFILAEDIAGLELGYTSVTQKSIFSKNPFKPNGNIRKFKVGTRLIDGKRTFGESQALRDRIESMVLKSHFDEIRNQNKLLGITVANLVRGVAETKTNKDTKLDGALKYTDHEMRDWIWASSNNPLFMSDFIYTDPDTLETHSYADGGVTAYANIQYVLDEIPNVTDIDVIFHNTKGVIRPDYDINSKAISRLMRIIDMQSAEINKNDLSNAQLRTSHIEGEAYINLNIYYMSDLDVTSITGPSRNSLLFDKQRMQTGVMRGYVQTKNGTILKEGCSISCKTGKIEVKNSNL